MIVPTPLAMISPTMGDIEGVCKNSTNKKSVLLFFGVPSFKRFILKPLNLHPFLNALAAAAHKHHLQETIALENPLAATSPGHDPAGPPLKILDSCGNIADAMIAFCSETEGLSDNRWCHLVHCE